jgi:membrane-associated phospholipid phosphatase
MKRILFALLCVISIEASAQNEPKKLGDTLKKDLLTAPDTVKRLHSKPWAIISPIILIAYGASSFAATPVRNFDYYIHREIEKTGPNFHTKAESYFQFAPVAIVYGLNLVGIEGKNRFVDRTALLGLSGGILATFDFGLKHFTHRLRPNGNDYYSFPSGHTSTAFLGAEFMAQEYSGKSPLYGVLSYVLAGTTGVFRMYNRDHWFSDVVAGAGFGILSTKVAYLVYPYIRNALTHKDKNGKSTLVMPTYQDGVVGLAFAKQL